MKKSYIHFFNIKNVLNSLLSISLSCFLLVGCSEEQETDVIKFGTSADYPPFEFLQNGQMVGFEIDLGDLVAKELGKKALFLNIQFSNILPALNSGKVHVGLSTFSITPERQEQFDFTDSYYKDSLAMVYLNKAPIKTLEEMRNKTIACQLGTTMELWLKKYAVNSVIQSMDLNNQAIEALKAGHVSGVLIDAVQAAAFVKENNQLGYTVVSESDAGYAMVLKKNSALTAEINKVLKILEERGELTKLKNKWLAQEYK